MTAETISTGTRARARIAVICAAALTALAGCGTEEDPTAEDTAGAEQPSATASSEPTESPSPTDSESATRSPSPTASSSATASPAAERTVPVYYVADTPQGPRLFREFHRVPGSDPLKAAADLVTSGKPSDPDYRTLYPGGEFAKVSFDGSAFVVQLADDGWSTPASGQDGDEARLAVQQLVHTLQGVQQKRAPVKVVNSSGEPSPLFGIDTRNGVKAAPPLDVLGLMSVTTPAEGQEVPDTFTAEGVGSSFEANVVWQVRNGSGGTVLEGFTTAEGWMDRLYPWQAQVDVSKLQPGTYTFVAMTDDPSDGEGAGPTEDTKTITVK